MVLKVQELGDQVFEIVLDGLSVGFPFAVDARDLVRNDDDSIAILVRNQ
jgi:hypothetical protein